LRSSARANGFEGEGGIERDNDFDLTSSLG
jgi:hypothetical protein